ncbi:hypothetical protein LUZ60_005959 [Juncus effusus]|nr:hypothetical protein LUZ60_005959 [Juncus effusus]
MPPFGERLVIEHHPHPLSYRRDLPLYQCDGCGQYGFNVGNICRACKFVLHEECFVEPDADCRSKYLSCKFTLLKTPCEPDTQCKACGDVIRKYVYACKDLSCHYKLHPACAGLPNFLEIGRGVLLELKKSKHIKCYHCNRCHLPGRKSYWAYVSSETQLQIGYVWDILTDQGKRGVKFHESRVDFNIPVVNLPRMTNNVRDGLFKRMKIKLVSSIASALGVADPTIRTSWHNLELVSFTYSAMLQH